ncbi:MAG: SusF/SusE family outer membrane protein [Sphingobacteriales bacterium]|nr:MAG: SusF/SusE family outer membrane protein [Sphingobacteriales bacterium]
MKKLFTQFILLSAALLFILSACKKDETQAVLDVKSAGALKASATTLNLKRDDADKVAVTFDFTETDFGYNAAANNVLQIAVEGTNFATPKEVILEPKMLSKIFKVIDFNALMLSLGLPVSVDSKIQARLKSQLNDKVGLNYSNVINMTVNPFPLTSFLYVPGAYQGWNPSNAESLISPLSDNIYTGVINFTPGNLMFKIVTKRSWGPPEYGKGASDGLIAVGGGDIAAPKTGWQKLTANTIANTLTFEDYSFGMLGDASPGGWDNDTVMAYDNATQTWSVTLVLKTGKIKFRLNGAWALNYGGKDGVLSKGGDDIVITEAGTFKVSFSIPESTYTLTKQ